MERSHAELQKHEEHRGKGNKHAEDTAVKNV